MSGETVARKLYPENLLDNESRLSTTVKKLVSVILLVGALAFLAIFFARPYQRLERLTNQLLVERAPGLKLEGVDIRFPASITLTNLDIPVRLNKNERRLRIEKLSGNLSVLPLLKGILETEMDSDFLGGILWIQVRTKALPQNPGPGLPPLVFDARARRLDLVQVCSLLETPLPVTGRCDIDAEGTMQQNQIQSLRGSALLIGDHIEIPPVNSESVSLPANHSAEARAKMTFDQGKVLIQDFLLTGSAYDLSGTATVALEEPFENSPVDGSIGMIFKERFAITDRRLSGDSADSIADALVNSKSRVTFKVSGTLDSPGAEIDVASSLTPLMKHLAR